MRPYDYWLLASSKQGECPYTNCYIIIVIVIVSLPSVLANQVALLYEAGISDLPMC